MCKFVALFLLCLPAWADLIPSRDGSLMYSLTLCGATPCPGAPAPRTPTAADLAGLTDTAFADFYRPFFGDLTGPWNWSITDSNIHGFIVGFVDGPHTITAPFIFRGGKVLCCTIDDPARIFDVNDNDIFVGSSVPGHGIIGSGFFSGFMVGNSSLMPEFPGVGPPDPSVDFFAVDNAGDLWGSTHGGDINGYFMLAPVPEPAAWILLATVCTVAFWRRGSRHGHREST